MKGNEEWTFISIYSIDFLKLEKEMNGVGSHQIKWIVLVLMDHYYKSGSLTKWELRNSPFRVEK